ncbi:MAG: chain length determinant protein EpsF [Methylophilaceae bacterium]
MTLSQLISILKARSKVIALIVLLTIAAGLALGFNAPKKFRATNTVIYNYKYSDPISGSTIPAQLIPGYMATEVDIISSITIAKEVVKKLELNTNQDFIDAFNDEAEGEGDIDEWIAGQLIKKLSVKPSRSSNLIGISIQASSAEFAAKVANAISEAYIKKSVELKVEPSRTAANFYTAQLTDLQSKVDLANQEYTRYQHDNGIQNVDGTVDVETARLNELSNQLVVVQAQLTESRSRKRAARRGGSPDVVADAVVQMHKASLARAQAEFAVVASKYASNHPDYIAAQSHVNQARSSLNRQMGTVSRSVSSSAKIFAQSEAEIKKSLEAQRTKVLNLNVHRNQVLLLKQTLENAQQAYSTANQRFIKSNFEGESNQSNVTVLNKAFPPRHAYFPNKTIILLLAAVLGPILGVGFVLLSELLDRRIRSVEDMEAILGFPIYGTLPKTELKLLNTGYTKFLDFKS